MGGVKGRLRVVIATPLGPGGEGGMDRLTDIVVEQYAQQPNLEIEPSTLTTRGHLGMPSVLFVFAHALAKFWYAIRHGDVDLLHLNLAHGGSLYRKLILARIAHRARIPYVVHLHGSRFDEFWAGASPVVQRWITLLFADSAAIVVLGRVWERLILRHLPHLQDRITILPNATESHVTRRIGNNSAPVQICFLGLIGERKGTFNLIAALNAIKDEDDWKATIAGNGEVEKCRAQVSELGLVDRITISGWLDAVGVEDLLSRTDIFVLPSTAENLPMSILEAFSFGIAVIATPVGAVPEVIEHGRNGLIVPVGNVGALANALRTLVRNAELRASIGQAAKIDHVNRYDVEVYVRRLAAIWHAAAERNSGLERQAIDRNRNQLKR